MAGIQFNPLLESLNGKVGSFVVKTYKGKPYLSRRPDMSRRKLSDKQREQNGRFKAASSYAKAALKVPELRALYKHKADAKSMPTVSIAIRDYLHPPEIHDIDLSSYNREAGNRILIRATDDVEVVKVDVTIYNSNGETIESGPACRSTVYPDQWMYTAVVSLPDSGPVVVVASATDRPGNVTSHAEAA